MSRLKSTLSRTLSDPVPTTAPPRSVHRRHTSLTIVDPISSKESPDSVAVGESGSRAVLDIELNRNTEHVVPRYGVYKPASGPVADQQASMRGRRADEGQLGTSLKRSNKMGMA